MIASNKVTERAQKRWNLIVDRFRAACVLNREKRYEESKRIIRKELPLLIKAWMQLLPASMKQDAKADLRDMFDREQALVDQGMRLKRVFKDTLVNSIIPKVEARIAAKYRSLYISGYDRRKEERDSEENQASWVSPSYNQPRDRRVKLDDVSEMIDELQRDEVEEKENLADKLVNLEDIVGRMKENNIEPILAS